MTKYTVRTEDEKGNPVITEVEADEVKHGKSLGSFEFFVKNNKIAEFSNARVFFVEVSEEQ